MSNWCLKEVTPDDRIPSPRPSLSQIPMPSPPLPPPSRDLRATPSPSRDRSVSLPIVRGYPTETYLLAADRAALALRACRDRVALPLARAAARFVGRSVWTSFGYARLEDHARERLGRSGRWVKDHATLGDALDSLPGLDSAITGEDGGRAIGRVAALVIARIATVESLASWIAMARSVTVRKLKCSVREARERGSVDPVDGSKIPEAAASQSNDSVAPRRQDPTTPPCEAVAAPREERHRVRIPVPGPLLAAFDETLELYRAVEGHESSVTSFVESLVADASAGGHPPDADEIPLRRGPGQEQIESALGRSTDGWSHLPPASVDISALRKAEASLLQIDDVARRAGTGGPGELDAQMRELIAIDNTIDRRLGRLLSEMAGHRAWVRLRFAGTGHYAEQRLGMARAAAGDRVRVERALRALPIVRSAYEEGRIGLEALGLSVGGDGPDGDCLSQVATSALDPDVFLQLRLPRDLAAAFLAAIESARRRLIGEAEAQASRDEIWDESSIPMHRLRPSLVAARMFSIRCRRTPAWAGLLALLEEFIETWDARDPSRHKSRDAIYIRDGWRCSAPGCSSRRNLEDHHLVYLSRRGGHGHSNRLCLCRFHHQMGEHGGLASCRGKAPLGVVWRLGREPLASWFRNERRIEARP